MTTELAVIMESSAELKITPGALFFGVVSQAQPSNNKLTFLIKPRSDRFEDLNFRDNSGLVDVKAVENGTPPPEGSRRYLATIQIDSGAATHGARSISGEISIGLAGIPKAVLPWTVYLTD